ncbi:MAG: hypothetical protein QG608_1619 [Actinomycetota bacterium]|jgi:hypothetical protein|nr:hypothetical protein [Actinomycetota bacterium]
MKNDPRIASYLADLERVLAESGTPDPLEVIASVREHIDAALEQDDADITVILHRLGPVERIAAEFPGSGNPSRGRRAGLVLLVLATASLILLVPVPFLSVPLALAVGLTAIVYGRQDRSNRRLYRAATAVSAVTLLASAVGAAGLLAEDTEVSTPVPVVPVSSPGAP